MELSIVIPCLNEIETIEICINKCKTAIKKMDIDAEIILADNGSNDGSVEIAKQLGARVVNVNQKGYGNALKGGINSAKGKYIIMADCDNSYDFLQINKILPSRQEIVYDCWLPLTNNFVANGYVLHNSIEQDADLVLMIYRDQYYTNDKSKHDITDIIIAKHRNGPIGTINLIFDSDTASFGSIIN